MGAIFIISNISILIAVGVLLLLYGVLIALIMCRRFAREAGGERRPGRRVSSSTGGVLDFKMAAV